MKEEHIIQLRGWRYDELERLLVQYADDFRSLSPNEKVIIEVSKDQEVRGSWARPDWHSVKDNVHFVGRSDPNTDCIRLSRHAELKWMGEFQGDRSLELLTVGRNCSVRGLTLDGGEAALPSDWYSRIGVRSTGGGLTVRNCVIRGLRGAYKAEGTVAKAIECFAISTTADSLGGNIVEDVLIEGCPPRSYVSGLYFGTANNIAIDRSTPAGARTALPARSMVTKLTIDVGEGNWFALSGGRNVSVSDVRSRGMDNFVYNDTASMSHFTVSNFAAECSSVLVLKNQSAKAEHTDIALRDGLIRLIPRFVDGGSAPSQFEARVAELWSYADPVTSVGYFRGFRNLSFDKVRFTLGHNSPAVQARSERWPVIMYLACMTHGLMSNTLRFSECLWPRRQPVSVYTGAESTDGVPSADWTWDNTTASTVSALASYLRQRGIIWQHSEGKEGVWHD